MIKKIFSSVAILTIASLSFNSTAQQWGGSATQDGNLSRNGNVGIGTSTPSTLLSLGTPVKARMIALHDDINDWYGLGIQSSQFRFHVGNTNARFSFLASDKNEVMTVMGNGNVGIGTTTPAEKLEVNGNFNLLGHMFWHASKNISMTDAGEFSFDFANSDGNSYWHVWSPGTGTILSVKNNGNVGIGTSNPNNKLVIADGTNAISFASGSIGFNRNTADGAIYNTAATGWQFTARNERFSLEGYNGAPWTLFSVLQNGNFGIGTNAPAEKLEVSGNILTKKVEGDLTRTGVLSPEGLQFGASSSINGGTISMKFDAGFKFLYNGLSLMHISNGGNVGIGTINPTSMLTVNGKIEAEEIEVKNVAADYVFDKNYKLLSLSEIDAFIKEKGHLPGIAPANETEKGINVGEFTKKLLEKVEELTLHMIKLQEQNDVLKAQDEALKAQVEALIK